jgi:hypothetical protein
MATRAMAKQLPAVFISPLAVQIRILAPGGKFGEEPHWTCSAVFYGLNRVELQGVEKAPKYPQLRALKRELRAMGADVITWNRNKRGRWYFREFSTKERD